MEPTHLPETIILDVSAAVREFLSILQSFPAIQNSEADREYLPTEVVSGLFEYIADLDTAKGCIREFARERAELYHEVLTEPELELLESSIRALGFTVLEQLIAFNVYDASGALWYKFKEFIGYDLVLSRLTSEDIADYGPPV